MIDLHTHTTFSDGKNTPEEMVLSAIDKGVKTLGFSDHSYTPFDIPCCIKLEEIEIYKSEINRLKTKYKDKIQILCGIEQDYLSQTDTKGFDYVIGSVHYLHLGDEYIWVDGDPKHLISAADKYFGDDIYSLIEYYYELVGEVIEKTDAVIIGHFDLITKFCETKPFFDQNHPRYINAWKNAVDKLLKHNIPFEINTGAISRGYRTTPYPAEDIKEYITKNGGSFILSSDSHKAETIAFKFEEYK